MIVDCAVYRDGKRVPGVLDLEDALEAARSELDAFVWIGLHEPSAAEFDAVVEEFKLPALAVEDAMHAHQRPKFESYGDVTFLVLKPASYSDGEMVELGQVVIFISGDFIVSVRHGETRALHDVRLRLEDRPDLLRCGPSAVIYAILDQVVDDYGLVLRALVEQVDLVEQAVFSGIRANQGPTIYRLKREVIEFQRAAGPLLEAVEEMMSNTATPIHPEASHYFRDVQDHLERVIDHLRSLDQLLGSALSANLAEVGIRQNEDMRKISAWVAIVAVPTMIAGLYGMNFDHMPELGWQYGYPFALALMAGACSILYRSFKRNGWL